MGCHALDRRAHSRRSGRCAAALGALLRAALPHAAQMADECRRLLDELGDPELRSVALWKLEGYTNAEVAAKLGCVVGTVERKLRAIRTIWGKENALC